MFCVTQTVSETVATPVNHNTHIQTEINTRKVCVCEDKNNSDNNVFDNNLTGLRRLFFFFAIQVTNCISQ